MKLIEYGEKSCQGMFLTSPNSRGAQRNATLYFVKMDLPILGIENDKITDAVKRKRRRVPWQERV